MQVMVFLPMEAFQSVGTPASEDGRSAAIIPPGSIARSSKVSATAFNMWVSCSVVNPLPVELAITISAASLTNCLLIFYPFFFLIMHCKVLIGTWQCYNIFFFQKRQ